MAYGRIYIDNLRKKVNVIFDDLLKEKQLSCANFKREFKSRYPKDYDMLQYEYEFKLHEFKKNRRGQPKTYPIKPEVILNNMYENYYFKIITYPIIQENKKKLIRNIQCDAGKKGFKIRNTSTKTYNVIEKKTKNIVAENITLEQLKEMFPKEK